jgi:hypothetical protein
MATDSKIEVKFLASGGIFLFATRTAMGDNQPPYQEVE